MMLTTLPAFVLNSGTYGVGCAIATRFSDRQRRSRIVAEWIRAYLVRMGPLYIKGVRSRPNGARRLGVGKLAESCIRTGTIRGIPVKGREK